MKKACSVLCIIYLILAFSACAPNPPGKTDNAQVIIGTSAKFTADEIKSTEDCVLEKFKDFKGCELQKLWYDEERSDEETDAYLVGGCGSVNGTTKENVIVLFSNFHVNSADEDSGFTSDTDHINWNWVLIRDNKSGPWQVDTWGY